MSLCYFIVVHFENHARNPNSTFFSSQNKKYHNHLSYVSITNYNGAAISHKFIVCWWSLDSNKRKGFKRVWIWNTLISDSLIVFMFVFYKWPNTLCDKIQEFYLGIYI